MASGAHNILSKCDRALVAYIIAGGAGTEDDVWPLKRSLLKDVLPCTVCESRRAQIQDATAFSGNYEISALVKVRSEGLSATESENEADAPREEAEDRVSETFDLFFLSEGQSGEDLGTAITTAANDSKFTCLSCSVEGVEQGFEREGMGWVDIIHLNLVCAPSTIA